MTKPEQTFTASELKIALWAVIIAAIIAVLGMVIDQSWSRPSLGQYGPEGYANTTSTPGVLDARPVSGSRP